MDGVNKTRFSILTGITLSVLFLGLGSFVPNASAGSVFHPCCYKTFVWS